MRSTLQPRLRASASRRSTLQPYVIHPATLRRQAESDEYRAMLQEAIDKGEAPACPESGCGGRYIPRMPSAPSRPEDAVRMGE